MWLIIAKILSTGKKHISVIIFEKLEVMLLKNQEG